VGQVAVVVQPQQVSTALAAQLHLGKETQEPQEAQTTLPIVWAVAGVALVLLAQLELCLEVVRAAQVVRGLPQAFQVHL
jgi:hypothetical protein